MRILIFCHSLVSDWNHGNAHFLRGVARELKALGHRVEVYEPRHGWSFENLLRDHGPAAVERFYRNYPQLSSVRYTASALDLEGLLERADLVLVHEWNPPELVRAIGRIRRHQRSVRVLFHDTHHRVVSDAATLATLQLENYDGVLVFGAALKEAYLRRGWSQKVFIWHEAADVKLFKPMAGSEPGGELVFIGNWGDEERSAELGEFFLTPARRLKLRAAAYGVRYPQAALAELLRSGVDYRGWLPNYEVPRVLSGFRATVHVPRRPYVEALPGVPTIRVFEALACGIPLLCAPWEDVERLFGPEDFLLARDGREMTRKLRQLLCEPQLARALSARGLQTVTARHTCAHRAQELLQIDAGLRTPIAPAAPSALGALR